jgi:hypothetical protein
MRSPKIPRGAEVVCTYKQYEEHVQAFFRGHYHLLVAIGRPGLMKSYGFEERLGPTSHLIRGWTAPLQAYIETYRHRNKLLTFDDAEVLWKRPGGRVLLRSLCEHKPQKLVEWTSTTPVLTRAGVPLSFLTSSKVAIIANRFVFGDADEYEAFVDRGHLIYFDPPPLEVHVRVGEWFWDQQIYDHIGERLLLLENLSARLYTKAWERKKANTDWKALITEAYSVEGAKEFVQALEVDPACATVEERVKKFIEYTGKSRATYFNVKRELKRTNQLGPLETFDVPKRKLKGTPPVDVDIESEVAKAQKEDREPASGQGRPAEGKGSSAADLPEWYQYSDNPSDYNDFADYLADWWKRPRQPEDEQTGPAENQGTGELDKLRQQMEQAVQQEDYERAAALRDQIRRIEEGGE